MYYQIFSFYDRATWLSSKETKKTLSGSYSMIYYKQRGHERPKSPSKLYHLDQEETNTSESKWSLRKKDFGLFFLGVSKHTVQHSTVQHNISLLVRTSPTTPDSHWLLHLGDVGGGEGLIKEGSSLCRKEETKQEKWRKMITTHTRRI